MARGSRIEPEEDTDVNLTPMLDVVFILLIFFIVTATFVKTPGTQVSKINAEISQSIKSPIIVAIDGNDDIWVDRRQVKMREVYAIMQEMIEDNPAAEAMIQVDAGSTYGVLKKLQDNMVNAGIRKIDLSTESPG